MVLSIYTHIFSHLGLTLIIKTWNKSLFEYWILFIIIDDLAIETHSTISLVSMIRCLIILNISVSFMIIQHLNILYSILGLWFLFNIIFSAWFWLQTIIPKKHVLWDSLSFAWNINRLILLFFVLSKGVAFLIDFTVNGAYSEVVLNLLFLLVLHSLCKLLVLHIKVSFLWTWLLIFTKLTFFNKIRMI